MKHNNIKTIDNTNCNAVTLQSQKIGVVAEIACDL